jgi:hypothetical protein
MCLIGGMGGMGMPQNRQLEKKIMAGFLGVGSILTALGLALSIMYPFGVLRILGGISITVGVPLLAYGIFRTIYYVALYGCCAPDAPVQNQQGCGTRIVNGNIHRN